MTRIAPTAAPSVTPARHDATGAGTSTGVPTPVAWHRPLLAFAALMLALAVVCGIGMLADPRTLLGVSVWEKPLKFAISALVYSVTWAWLIGQLHRFRRTAWWAGTVAVVLLAIELVIIVGFAIAGETSHFNVSTPFHIVMWSVMAFSITALWAATFVVSIILFRNPFADAARTLAVRAGALIALAGMALAFLMTGPNADQLNDFQGVAGAHTVGVADGGPGLPILGWSTIAGDLRIPHFVGMHALQVIPLALLAIELLSRRIPRLRSVAVRHGLVWVITVAYAATLGLLTWQALRGQSIVQPDALALAAAGVIAGGSAVAAGVILAVDPAPAGGC